MSRILVDQALRRASNQGPAGEGWFEVPTIPSLPGGPTLSALSLSDTEGEEGSSVSISILGTTLGSTLSVSSGSLPTGLTLNSAARTITGTLSGAVGTSTFSLRETLSGATNSPQDTSLTFEVTAAGNILPLVSMGREGFGALWSGTAPSDATLKTTDTYLQDVTSPGFTSTGAATTYTRTLMAHCGYEREYEPGDPDVGPIDGNWVAFDDMILIDDVPAGGITNTSTERSPKPIVKVQTDDHKVVGNTTTIWIEAYHHFGIAAITWDLVQNGVTLSSGAVSSPQMRLFPNGMRSMAYRIDLDLTAVSEATLSGLFEFRWKTYPKIGSANADYALSSVHDSQLETDRKQRRSTLFFRKNVTRATTPLRAFVQTGASGGAVSTDVATARSTPFPTEDAALAAIVASQGDVDGAIIHLAVGTQITTHAVTARASVCGGYTLAKDPETVGRQPGLTVSSTASRRVGTVDPAVAPERWLRLSGLTNSASSGAWTTNNGGTKQVIIWLDDSSMSSTGGTTSWFSSASGNTSMALYNSTLIDAGGSSSAFSALNNNGILGMYGCAATNFGRIITTNHVTGCLFSNVELQTLSSTSVSFCTSAILSWSQNLNCSVNNVWGADNGNGSTITDVEFARVGLIGEVISTTTGLHNTQLSKDGARASIRHGVHLCCTYLGLDQIGRNGGYYAESSATAARRHVFLRTWGVHFVRVARKDGRFFGPHVNAQLACRGVARWSHAVGFSDNAFSIVGEFPKPYEGRRSIIGGNTPATTLDAGFVDRRAVFWDGSAPAAGAGNGDYRLAVGSVLRNAATAHPAPIGLLVPFYPDGSTRGTQSNIGARENG